ncbi:hypothetical protein HK101_002831 [Irineochytrium annulatum]|nr:hypothetical protein HK101_002831 [Irineochytrium annulatum]
MSRRLHLLSHLQPRSRAYSTWSRAPPRPGSSPRHPKPKRRNSPVNHAANPLHFLQHDIKITLEGLRTTHPSIPFLSVVNKTTPLDPLPPFPYPDGAHTGRLTVEGVSDDGHGFCIADGGWLLLVPTVMRGEVVVARPYQVDRTQCVAWCELVSVVTPSPSRVEPRCQHHAQCSGCSFQHVPYATQLEQKHEMIQRVFSAVEGAPDVLPVVPSPEEYGFRTKITPHRPSVYAGKEVKGIGFLQRGRTKSVVDMRECPVATDKVNEEFRMIREENVGKAAGHDRLATTWIIRNTLLPPPNTLSSSRPTPPSPATQPPPQQTSGGRLADFVATMKVPKETAFATSASAASAATTAGNGIPAKVPLAQRLGLESTLPWPQSWPPAGWTQSAVTRSQDIVADVVNGQLFRGEANNFFQLNSFILGHLTHHVRCELRRHAVDSRGVTTLIDAFCGTGLFALQCAADFERVIGIEVVQNAVRWARRNAADNGVSNAVFHVGNVDDLFSDVPLLVDNLRRKGSSAGSAPAEGAGTPLCDRVAVVIDPPKKGCSQAFLHQLIRFNPRVIIYVSCDATSQANDLKRIRRFGIEGVPPAEYDGQVLDSLRARVREDGKPTEDARRWRTTTAAGVVEGGVGAVYLGGKKVEVRDGVAKVVEPRGVYNNGLRLIPVNGYRIATIRPFDMFPQTPRTETVVTLVRDD